MKTVYCVKLKKELKALDIAPVPGDLGKKILENVSEEAWKIWLEHQIMLINENMLSLVDDSAQQFLKDELNKFFFSEEGASKIKGFIPPE